MKRELTLALFLALLTVVLIAAEIGCDPSSIQSGSSSAILTAGVCVPGSTNTNCQQTGFLVKTKVQGCTRAQIYDLKIVADHRILGVGTCGYDTQPSQVLLLVMYNSDGTLYSKFGQRGILLDSFNGPLSIGFEVLPLSDGTILAAATMYDERGTVNGSVVTKYTSTGERVTTFGINGVVTFYSYAFYSLDLQTDGKIVLGGKKVDLTSPDVTAYRLNEDGSTDQAFGTAGVATINVGFYSGEITSIKVQADGKIVVAGGCFFTTHNIFTIVRFNSQGNLDITFGNGGVVVWTNPDSSTFTPDLHIQSDGKILLSGTQVDTTVLFAALQLNPDGTPDITFGNGGLATLNEKFSGGASTWKSAIQPNGKIILGGNALSDGIYDFILTRFTSAGTVDKTFGTVGQIVTSSPIAGESLRGLAMAIDGSQYIYLAGYYSSNVNGEDVGGLALAKYQQ